MPKVGPCEGCRTQANTFFFSCDPMAWLRPMVVVLLPSPRGVGVIPATTTYLNELNLYVGCYLDESLPYLPGLLSASLSITPSDTLALRVPKSSSSLG